MTEAKYIGRISPVLADDWTDKVPTYYSHYNYHMRRKAARKQLKKERYAFIFVCAVLVCILMMTFSLSTQSRETYASNISHSVIYGETLWEIANEYKSDDVTTGVFVHQIRKINNLKSSEIKAGDVLIIPE